MKLRPCFIMTAVSTKQPPAFLIMENNHVLGRFITVYGVFLAFDPRHTHASKHLAIKDYLGKRPKSVELGQMF